MPLTRCAFWLSGACGCGAVRARFSRLAAVDGGAHLGSLMWPKLLGHRARIRRGSIQRLGGPSAKPESWPQLTALAVLAAVGGVAAHYYAPVAIAGVS